MPFTLVIVSDLHFGHDEAGDQGILELAGEVISSGADALAICGDVASGGSRGFSTCLELFAPFPGVKLVVPGNHDLWAGRPDEELDVMNLYNEVLPRISASHGFKYLDSEGPVNLGDNYYIAGTAGWFDWSFRDESLPASDENYRRQEFLGFHWNDRRGMAGEFNDLEFHAAQLENLRRQLDALPEDAVAACIFHMVPDAVLLPPRPEDIAKRFARAFLGSPDYGRLLRLYSQLRLVACGHTHDRADTEDGGIRWINAGGGSNKTAVVVIIE